MCFNAVVHTTVKPSNKGHIGDNVYSHVLSLVERLSFYQRFKIIVLLLYIGNQNFWIPRTVHCIERFLIQCPFLGGFTVGGFTVMVSSYNYAGKTNLNHVGLCINFHSIIEAGLKSKIKIKLCNKDQGEIRFVDRKKSVAIHSYDVGVKDETIQCSNSYCQVEQ